MINAAKILQKLKPGEPLYKLKVKILSDMIADDYTWHILDDRLVKWALKVGISVESVCEDKTSWYSCKIENNGNSKNKRVARTSKKHSI